MPFQSLPIPLTYVDISQVTDSEHERLKVTFENGMGVMLRKTSDDFGRQILSVDKHNSDVAALKPIVQACFENQKNYKKGTQFLGIRFMRQVTNYTCDEVDERIRIYIGTDYRELLFSPVMPGYPLKVMATLPEAGGGGYTLANESLVAKLESVVIGS
jgi:hypothetical protein